MPILLSLGSTITLDILNHMMAKKSKNDDSNIGVVISNEERKRREKIPKRATMINSGLVIFAIASSAIPLKSFDLDLETRALLFVVMVALLNTLRNPIIARLAFQVNKQIQRETVEDKRQKEIKDALEKRAERQRTKDEQNGENYQPESTIKTSVDIPKTQGLKKYVIISKLSFSI